MRVFDKADILIPENTDPVKWSVVACDQYTSQPEYWDAVKKFVGGSPSSLNIIFPEIYLNDGSAGERIQAINSKMEEYLASGIFHEYESSLILVERTLRSGKKGYGLIGTVDLEQYDFSKGSTSLIRATEGTVLSRIPPRVAIRENAALEVPHIIMLIDDDENTAIEPLVSEKDSFTKIYDFDLQMDSGHLAGYLVSDEAAQRALSAIDELGERSRFTKKYATDKATLQFAVGDGNHSLATAKTCWENIKKTLTEEERKTHPARFALVELMNVHDSSIDFEPIHRVVFDIQPNEILSALKSYYRTSDTDEGGQRIDYCFKGTSGFIYINDSPCTLAVGSLERFFEIYYKNLKIDYIHGAEVVRELSEKDGTIGFILPPMAKSDLFRTVINDGALPRKTFSMGEAHDKRFYMECKII